MAGVLDRGQPDDLAGGGEPPDVPDAGGVDFLAVHPPDDGAVGDGHPDPLRGEQLDLGGEEAGPGAVDDQAVGVASEEALEGRIQEVGEGPAGGGCPEDRGEVGEGVAVAAAVGGQRQGRDAPGDQVDAGPDGAVLHGRGGVDGHRGVGGGHREVADLP